MTPDSQEALYTRMVVLFGEEDVDWEYIYTDPKRWWLRLWLRRN